MLNDVKPSADCKLCACGKPTRAPTKNSCWACLKRAQRAKASASTLHDAEGGRSDVARNRRGGLRVHRYPSSYDGFVSAYQAVLQVDPTMTTWKFMHSVGYPSDQASRGLWEALRDRGLAGIVPKPGRAPKVAVSADQTDLCERFAARMGGHARAARELGLNTTTWWRYRTGKLGLGSLVRDRIDSVLATEPATEKSIMTSAPSKPKPPLPAVTKGKPPLPVSVKPPLPAPPALPTSSGSAALLPLESLQRAFVEAAEVEPWAKHAPELAVQLGVTADDVQVAVGVFGVDSGKARATVADARALWNELAADPARVSALLHLRHAREAEAAAHREAELAAAEAAYLQRVAPAWTDDKLQRAAVTRDLDTAARQLGVHFSPLRGDEENITVIRERRDEILGVPTTPHAFSRPALVEEPQRPVDDLDGMGLDELKALALSIGATHLPKARIAGVAAAIRSRRAELQMAGH